MRGLGRDAPIGNAGHVRRAEFVLVPMCLAVMLVIGGMTS
jgi:hypothetical protein